jgi:hypothetical protein
VHGLALWNGRDAILKERMFGLSNTEGNHGEDVKEYFFYLENTPTHSYARMLYKYPQVAYPYDDLVAENGRRGSAEPEYELIDAIGDAFKAGRYFDVFVEYAKAGIEDIACRVRVVNRGCEAAPFTSCLTSGIAIPGRGCMRAETGDSRRQGWRRTNRAP